MEGNGECWAVYRKVGPHWYRVSREFPNQEQARRYEESLPRDWVLTVRASVPESSEAA